MDTVDLETYMITATYSDATQYSDDVYPYENGCTKRSVVSLSTPLNGTQIYDKYIKPRLADPEIFNFYYNRQGYSGVTYDPTKTLTTQEKI